MQLCQTTQHHDLASSAIGANMSVYGSGQLTNKVAQLCLNAGLIERNGACAAIVRWYLGLVTLIRQGSHQLLQFHYIHLANCIYVHCVTCIHTFILRHQAAARKAAQQHMGRTAASDAQGGKALLYWHGATDSCSGQIEPTGEASRVPHPAGSHLETADNLDFVSCCARHDRLTDLPQQREKARSIEQYQPATTAQQIQGWLQSFRQI